ncbi:AfsA-related hotdog domain-containing protein [Streptomyces coelicoflavus]|uniref:AfsA-related hotdog domain-containing protein n=1 Tax=Streptomyces coelicoflavus TaxID=285562 RepID=UPI00381019E2
MSEQLLKSVCLVGDRFSSFATHDGVHTVSSFAAAVRSGEYDGLTGPLLLWEGQGVSAYDRDYVRAALEAAGLTRKILMQPNEPEVVPRAEAHKHREVNVLISGLQQQGPDTYRAALRLHSDNELLLDHQTGEHIQGMVVIETFRQMFMAFCDKFVAVQCPEYRHYYIWHSMDIGFDNFLFPLDADVVCTVESAETDDPSRLRFTVALEVHQAGNRAAHARISFTAYDADRLAPKEHRLAGAAVTAVLDGAAPEPAVAGTA